MSWPFVQTLLDMRARADVCAFGSCALRDEVDGQLVHLEPFHRDILSKVGDPRVELLVVECFAGAGKSSLGAAGVTWLLGPDPTLRVAFVSNTLAQAAKQVGTVARLIESPDTQRIFPTLRPGSQWTQTALSVAAKPSQIRDPNVQAASLDGAGLLGARLDLIVLDDLDSLATTSTPAARDATYRWVAANCLSRRSARGRIIVLTTTWHREDVAHRLIALGGATHVRVPIQDAYGRPTWPAKMPADRIVARRRELGPRLAGRVLDCKASSDDSCVFDSALVRAMVDRGLAMPTTFYSGPRGRCIVGVDVAFSTGPTSDESAIVVVRCCEDSGVREVVHVESGRWNLDTLSARVIEVTRAFGGVAAIESNGGGGFVHEQVKKHAPAVALHTSQTSKLARVEMLHAEMSAGRWIFRPRDGVMTEGMRALADGLETYAPDEHTDDRVAALLVAVEQVRAHENRPTARWFAKHEILGRR